MNREIRTSNHGEERTKKRLGISKRLATENAKRAIQYGFDKRMAHGQLRRYLDKYDAPITKVYNRRIYLFSATRCLITVMNLPNSLCVRADAIQRKQQEAKTTAEETAKSTNEGEM